MDSAERRDAAKEEKMEDGVETLESSFSSVWPDDDERCNGGGRGGAGPRRCSEAE